MRLVPVVRDKDQEVSAFGDLGDAINAITINRPGEITVSMAVEEILERLVVPSNCCRCGRQRKIDWLGGQTLNVARRNKNHRTASERRAGRIGNAADHTARLELKVDSSWIASRSFRAVGSGWSGNTLWVGPTDFSVRPLVASRTGGSFTRRASQ
jgi:hypothetical protein